MQDTTLSATSDALQQQPLQYPHLQQQQARPHHRRLVSGDVPSGSFSSPGQNQATTLRSSMNVLGQQMSNPGTVSGPGGAVVNAGSPASGMGPPLPPLQEEQQQQGHDVSPMPPVFMPGSTGPYAQTQNVSTSTVAQFQQQQQQQQQPRPTSSQKKHASKSPHSVQPPLRASSRASMHSPTSAGGPISGQHHYNHPLAQPQDNAQAQQTQFQPSQQPSNFPQMPQPVSQSIVGQIPDLSQSQSQSQAQHHALQQQQQQPPPPAGHRPSVNFENLAQDIMRLQSQLSSARALIENRDIYDNLPNESKRGLAHRIKEQEGQLDQLRRIYDQAVRAGQMQQQQQQQQQSQQQQSQTSQSMPPQPSQRPLSSIAQSVGSLPQQQQQEHQGQNKAQPLQPIPYQRAPSLALHGSRREQDQQQQQQQQQYQHNNGPINAASSPASIRAPSPVASVHSPQSSPHISNAPQQQQQQQQQRPSNLREGMMPPPSRQFQPPNSQQQVPFGMQQMPLNMENQQIPSGE